MIQTIKNHNVLSIKHNQTMKVISSSERCSSSDRWRSDGPCFLSCEEISQCAKVKYTLEGCVKHRWSAGKIEEWTQNLNWNCHLNAFFQVKLTDIPWFSFYNFDFHMFKKKKLSQLLGKALLSPESAGTPGTLKSYLLFFFAENHPQSSMFANFPAFVLRGKPLYGYYQLIWPKKKKPPATESPSVWRKKAFNEGDEGLKLEGVLNIGAFIAQSERLVVVWDSTYATRAWLLGWSPLKPNIFCGWGTN